MKKFELSEQAKINIEKSLTRAGETLKQEMQICEIDHMQVSLDLNFNSTGKFMGVKYSVFRMERIEHTYDEDFKE